MVKTKIKRLEAVYHIEGKKKKLQETDIRIVKTTGNFSFSQHHCMDIKGLPYIASVAMICTHLRIPIFNRMLTHHYHLTWTYLAKISHFFLLKIYALAGKSDREGVEKERNLCAGSLPKWLQLPGLVQVESSSFEVHLGVPCWLQRP